MSSVGTVDDHGYVMAEVNGRVGLVPLKYILPVPAHMRDKILRATRVSVNYDRCICIISVRSPCYGGGIVIFQARAAALSWIMQSQKFIVISLFGLSTKAVINLT